MYRYGDDTLIRVEVPKVYIVMSRMHHKALTTSLAPYSAHWGKAHSLASENPDSILFGSSIELSVLKGVSSSGRPQKKFF